MKTPISNRHVVTQPSAACWSLLPRLKRQAHRLLLPLLLVGVAGPALAGTPPVPDLAWWKGEGNALDASANNNTAAVNGSMKYVPGVVGQGFDFSSQAVLRVTNCAALRPANSFTISAWVNAINPGAFRQILCKPFTSSANSYDLYTGQNGGLQGFLFFNNPSTGVPMYAYMPTADPGLLWDGTWHFVAGSLEGSESGSDFRLWVDGRQVASWHTNSMLTLVYESTNNNGDVIIGDFAPTPTALSHFNGQIDELKMYSRALTAQEMLDSFTSVETNLISWWRAEKDASDYIGANHGTLVASAKYSLGRYGSCFGLTGGMVQIPDDPSLRPAQFTLEARVRASSPRTNAYLVSKSFSASGASYALRTGPDGTLSFCVSLPGGVVASPAAPASIWDNEFHSVFGTYDGAKVRLFVDGAEVGAGTAAAGAVQYGTAYNAGQLLFGDFESTPSANNFAGWVDEVKLFNRALSAQEVAGRTPKVVGGIVQPAALTVLEHATTNAFTVVGLGGNGTLTYRWRKDGSTLAGQTAKTLSLTDVQVAQAGQYDVQVTVPGVTYVDGTNGQAFRIGTAGLVRVGNSPALEPPGSVTLQCWVRGSGNQTYRYIVAKLFNTANAASYSLDTGTAAANGARFLVRYDTSASSFLAAPQAPAASVWDGKWHQLTGIYDYDVGAVRLYLDGTEVGGGTSTFAGMPLAYNSLVGNGDLLIGDVNVVSAYHYTNDVDEVKIWNRALTAEEVASSLTTRVAPESLVAWFRADGNTMDSSTNLLSSLALPQTGSCISAPGILTVVQPQPTRLTNCIVAGGLFRADVVGTAGATYVVQASSTFSGWTPIFTNVVPFTFSDPVGSGARFYRAVSQP